MADGALLAHDKRWTALGVAMAIGGRSMIGYCAAILKHAGDTDRDILLCGAAVNADASEYISLRDQTQRAVAAHSNELGSKTYTGEDLAGSLDALAGPRRDQVLAEVGVK